jgi:hypothetical protein
MKLYLWKHKDTAMQPYNFYSLAKLKAIKPNGFYAISAHAFFRKKDAKEYLNEIGWSKEIQEYYELATVTLNERKTNG